MLADVLSSPRQSFAGLLTLVPILLALESGPVTVVVASLPLLGLVAAEVLAGPQSTEEEGAERNKHRPEVDLRRAQLASARGGGVRRR